MREKHRPLKGATPRDAQLAIKVERWAKDALLDDAAPGESQADTFQRWAASVRDAKAGA